MSKNIVFIDSRVAGYETLIASLSADSEWHLLDAAQDGLDQMQRVLEGCTGLDSIHIVSHGASGTLYLGSTVLNSINLTNYQSQLQAIGASLTETGDILLYGCNVAQGDAGMQFIDSLARLTGADVAASDDLTGRGGNVQLEQAAGRIEASGLELVRLETSLATSWYDPDSDPQGKLLIDGIFQQGQQLTAINSLVDVNGMRYGSYRWYEEKDGQPVLISETASVVLGQDQVGKKVWAVFSYVNKFSYSKNILAENSYGVVSNVNDAPTGSVSISGTARQGQTLTASNNLADADGLGTIAYQWLADGAAISGANASTLTLGQAQVGKTISVKASYTDGQGTAESVTSSGISSPVLYESEYNDDRFYADAFISSAAGNLSSASDVDWYSVHLNTLGMQTVTFDASSMSFGFWNVYWYDQNLQVMSGRNIDTKSFTYQFPALYEGTYYIRVQPSGEFLYNGGTYKIYLPTSNANVPIANVNDAPTGSITISGTAKQGQTLTTSNNLADADGLGMVHYQWKANGAALSGATGSSYTMTQAVVGKTITVTASYTDGQGTTESKTSPATAAVANVNDLPTGSVTVSGTATKGLTLTAANTLADVDGLGKISYQWKVDGKAISGATGSTYQLTQTEVGKAITITASYIDSQGTAESKTSAATKAVLNGLTAGTTGNDTLMGTYGADRMTGQTGNDLYYVNHASDVIAEAASGGTDTVYSYLSSYTLGANVENGYLMSSAAATLTGNGLANTLRGGVGKDTLDGGAGADTADYSDKSVAVVATLNGATAVSVKVGGVAEDSIKNIENLSGGSAADNLTGDTLANTLVGNAGNDILRGGLGNDILTGGTGQDFFRFDAALNRTSNVDRITDFSAIDDTIQLENSIFTKFGSTTTGTLSINYFKAITTGGTTDSNDYIVYNKTTGALYYDADGGADGNTDGIQFATVALVATAPLTNADFVLI